MFGMPLASTPLALFWPRGVFRIVCGARPAHASGAANAGAGLVHVPHPLLLLLVAPLPDKVDGADLLEPLACAGGLVRGPEAVNRESGEEVALRLVVRPVECAVRVVVMRQLGADRKVEQPARKLVGSLQSLPRRHALLLRQVDVELARLAVAVRVVHHY